MAILGSKLGPSFLIFPFFVFQKDSSFCKENEIFQQKKETEDKNYHFFESKFGPIMLRNMLGPKFDSTLGQALTQPFWHFLAFFPFQNMLKQLIL